MRRVMVVDGANVVGATPNGWWRDRAGAAAKLHGRLITADTPYDDIVLVLEGQAKAGIRAGIDAHVRTVHAPRDGDSAIVKAAADPVARGDQVTVITADRMLRARVESVGAQVMSPSWLLDQLDNR
ncbi:MAG: NYN domain-containing protein [Nocardioides sp.]